MTAHVSIPAIRFGSVRIEEQQHELVMQMGNQPCSGDRPETREANSLTKRKQTQTSLHVSTNRRMTPSKGGCSAGAGIG